MHRWRRWFCAWVLVALLTGTSATAHEWRATDGMRFVLEKRDLDAPGHRVHRLECRVVLEGADSMKLIQIEYRDSAGVTWMDSQVRGPMLDARIEHYPATSEDTVVAMRTLRLDGRAIRCRVVRRPYQYVLICGVGALRAPPVRGERTFVESADFWEPEDAAGRPRTLRFVERDRTVRYEPGRPPRIRDDSRRNQQWVTSLHSRVRVRGRSHDCWVARGEVRGVDGRVVLRRTWWCADGTPEGWVRLREERRDPRTGRMTRTIEEVTDIRMP